MKRPGNGPYSAGYLGKQDEPLAATKPIRSDLGDIEFDRLMGQKSYQDARVKPAGGSMPRPEPLPVPGTGSSLTSIGGGGTGRRHGDGTSGRWGQR